MRTENLKHIHLHETPSTQQELKNILTTCIPTLISTEKQTKGVGRGQNRWLHLDNALAFSFSLLESPLPLNLLPLQVGVSLCNFLKEYQLEASLKWPNDLLNNKGEKVGGILCQHIKGVTLVGIGLNWGKVSTEAINTDYPWGSLSEKTLSSEELKALPEQFYRSFNFLDQNDLITQWNKLCFHLNHSVTIIDNDKETSGLFQGINEHGAAQILNDETIEEVYSGSLFMKMV